MTFAAISTTLRVFGIWCFPLRFRLNDAGKYEKLPLVAWKALQSRQPTEDELAHWRIEFSHAVAAGIPTGAGTHIVVIDADSPDAIEWLELRGMPETWLVRSRRGLHYYFRYCADIDIHNSASIIGPGIDVRGIGGMVAAAGSQLPDGFTYGWDYRHSPQDLPLAKLPPWLLKWFRADAERRKASVSSVSLKTYRGEISIWARKAYDAELERLRTAAIGTRHNTFLSVARRLGQLVGGGELEESEVLAALHRIADGWPSRANSYQAIADGFRYGLAQPRGAPPPTLFHDADPLGSEHLSLYGGAA